MTDFGGKLFQVQTTGQAAAELIVSPTGIASAEAFGTATFGPGIIASGVSSEEAFGTATVGLGVVVPGIPSEEVFGTPTVGLQITGTGIPSEEAFGTAEFTAIALVIPSGIPSKEAFGTPIVGLQISPSGIASEEAFGTAEFAHAFVPTGIPSEEAFGTAAFNNPIAAIGIPSEEAFGDAIFAGPVIAPGIPSEEAFGTAIVAGPIIATGIPSEEAFGTPAISRTIQPTGIPGGEAFGDFTTSRTIPLEGIPSAEAFGLSSFGTEQFVTLTGIPSAEAFGAHRIGPPVGRIAGGEEGQRGPTTGGQEITLVGIGLDMLEAERAFPFGSIDAGLWVTDVASSAQVRALPNRSVALYTGLGVDSFGALRTVRTQTRSDVSVRMDLTLRKFKTGTSSGSMFLGAYANASSHFRVHVDVTRTTVQLRMTSTVNGSVIAESIVPLKSASSVTLRLLRDGGTVYTFLNKRLVRTHRWTTVAAATEFGVRNDSSGAANIWATVSEYERRPVILFDRVPMRDIRFRGRGIVTGVTPAKDRPGLVTLLAETHLGEHTFSQQYEYFAATDYRLLGTEGGKSLTVVSDTAVRNG